MIASTNNTRRVIDSHIGEGFITKEGKGRGERREERDEGCELVRVIICG